MAMAVPARRALARAAQALPGRLGASVVARAVALRCATAAPVATAVPRQLAPRRSLAAASQQLRWYSAGSGSEAESQVPGSRLWSFEEVKRQIEDNKAAGESSSSPKKVVIVDVREPGELHATGKIPGAINIPITSAVQSFHVSDADFEDMYGFERPPRDATLLFYCKAGVRARSAAGLAKHAGWESVGEYPGSWLDWEVHGGPVEKA